jgi:hypothetical protein
MKLEIRTVRLGSGERQLAGRVLGDRVYDVDIAPALKELGPGSIVVLSLRDIEFVTGSVLKATWHRLHPDEGIAIPSVAAHLSDDVRSEFAIYLKGHSMAGLEALDWNSTSISRAILHGEIEDSSFAALEALCADPGSTAPQLQGLSNENVSATAWTNRLNELHRQGLAFREKAGRAWRFFTIAREVRRG